MPPVDQEPRPATPEPEQITAEAVRIIDAAPPYGPLEPEKYAKALPLEAGVLARVLLDKEIVDLAESYRRADRIAVGAQRRCVWPARTGLVTLYASVLLAGFGVYLWTSNDPSLTEPLLTYFVPVQSVFVLITLLCVVAAYVSAPRQKWLGARPEAERCRSQLFRRLMTALVEKPGSEAWLLALKLECFRRHLLEDQLRFFDRRISRYRLIAFFGPVFTILVVALVGTASLPHWVSSLDTLGMLERMPDPVRRFLLELVADKKIFAISYIYGFALQVLVYNLAFVSPVARHVERYEVTSAVLSFHASRLDEARDAAANASLVPVMWFARGIQDALDAEQDLWRNVTAQGGVGK